MPMPRVCVRKSLPVTGIRAENFSGFFMPSNERYLNPTMYGCKRGKALEELSAINIIIAWGFSFQILAVLRVR